MGLYLGLSVAALFEFVELIGHVIELPWKRVAPEESNSKLWTWRNTSNFVCSTSSSYKLLNFMLVMYSSSSTTLLF